MHCGIDFDRSIAEMCFHIIAGSVFSDPAIMSDHMETRLKSTDISKLVLNLYYEKFRVPLFIVLQRKLLVS